jgi:hypothetical protein
MIAIPWPPHRYRPETDVPFRKVQSYAYLRPGNRSSLKIAEPAGAEA